MKMRETEFTKNVLAIVCFGPATEMTGMRPADYYQVTIDPSACSLSGEYIRFGLYHGDEITGWQRVEAMTVLEVLGDSDKKMVDGMTGYTKDENATVKIMKVE